MYADISALQPDEYDMFCRTSVSLPKNPNPKKTANISLENCAELVSLNKGKNGCHVSGIFMHVGNGAGGCWCSKDNCTERSNTTNLNIYKLSQGKKLYIIFLLCFGLLI